MFPAAHPWPVWPAAQQWSPPRALRKRILPIDVRTRLPLLSCLQSSSEAGTSRSCSGSSRSGSDAGSDAEEEERIAALSCRPRAAANGARTDHDRQRAQQAQRAQRRQQQAADDEDGNTSDAGPGPLRRQRQRGRRHRWRLGGGRGSGDGMEEIPAGPVPEQLRRRSDVGSVLEPDAQSELDEIELAAGATAH